MKKIMLTLCLVSVGFGTCISASLLNTIKEVSSVEPKMLKSQVVQQFAVFLNKKEFAAILVENLEIAVKTYKALEKYELEVPAAKKPLYDLAITGAMKKVIVSAAAPFLQSLYVAGKVLMPLLNESLGSAMNQSFLFRFLSPREMPNNFLQNSIQTKVDVRNICIEFARVFGDLACTLPAAFQAGQRYLEQKRKER
jgi:hypothetical protein